MHRNFQRFRSWALVWPCLSALYLDLGLDPVKGICRLSCWIVLQSLRYVFILSDRICRTMCGAVVSSIPGASESKAGTWIFLDGNFGQPASRGIKGQLRRDGSDIAPQAFITWTRLAPLSARPINLHPHSTSTLLSPSLSLTQNVSWQPC